MSETDRKAVTDAYNSIRAQQKAKRPLLMDFIFGPPRDVDFDTGLAGRTPPRGLPKFTPESSVAEEVISDPASFGKGLAASIPAGLADVVDLGQQGLNAAARSAVGAATGGFRPGEDFQPFGEPSLGNTVREAFGLNPESVAGIAGEVVSPVGATTKGAIGIAKLIGGTPELMQAGMKLASGTDFPAMLSGILFHGAARPLKGGRPSLDFVGSGNGLDAYGHGINLERTKAGAESWITDVNGRLYENEVPDRVLESALDWDKPLSEQPQLLAAIESDPVAARAIEQEEALLGTLSGEDVHEVIAMMDSGGLERNTEFASEWFRQRGVSGVAYDNGRGGGFTLFNPDEIQRVTQDGKLVWGSPAEGVTMSPAGARTLDDRIGQFLTDDEKALMTLGDRKAIEDLLKTSATPEEVASMAAAGGAKRGWYEESVKAIRHVFGEEDGHRFAALLSATSPQTSVESNLRNALNIWKNWDRAGRPTDRTAILRIMGDSVEGNKGLDSVLGAWVNNSIRALSTDDVPGLMKTGLSGPKVSSFMRNLAGMFGEVTQDTWMARALGLSQSRDFSGRNLVAFKDELGKLGQKKAGYFAGNVLVREAADIMTQTTGRQWTPAEVQETVWSWTKAIWESTGAAGEVRGIPEILKSGGVTDDIIRDTPDFGSLFRDNPEFHKILEDAGYGDRLSTIPESSFGRGGAVGLDAEGSGALESAARRLDRTSRERGKGTEEDVRQLVLGRFAGQGDAAGDVPGRFRRATERPRTGVLKGEQTTRHILPAEDRKLFERLGSDTPAMLETTNADKFHEAIVAAKEANTYGAAVTAHSADTYKDMKLFMSRDGSTGFAIAPDGELVSVFNNRTAGNHEGVTPYLVALAVENGATKLSAYDIGGGLPRLYGMAGFDEVSRTPWDEAFRPADWDDALGKPDFIEMELVRK